MPVSVSALDRRGFDRTIVLVEFLFLSLTVEALQGKTYQNSQPSGVGRSL